MIEQTIKKVILADISPDMAIEKVPGYMDYYHLIRAKISKNAYHYYTNNARGGVFLTFTVLNNGNLANIGLKPSSNSNARLQQIALRSVKDAAPFTVFPPELSSYPSLEFNIAIYFKSN